MMCLRCAHWAHRNFNVNPHSNCGYRLSAALKPLWATNMLGCHINDTSHRKCFQSRVDRHQLAWQRCAASKSTPFGWAIPGATFIRTSELNDLTYRFERNRSKYKFSFEFSESENTCAFSYELDNVAIIRIECIAGTNYVAAGMENGRIYLLDSTCYPIKCVNAKDDFVLADACINNKLSSLTTYCSGPK